MISFYKDWFNPSFRGVSVHYKTKNKSFLRFAGLLKFMGIRNHSFFLALFDKSIEDLDPHSKDLTRDEKVKIAEECKINFWYFLREVVRVPPPAGNEVIQFEANRANISLFWLYFNHVTSLLIQPRQTGKSLSIDILTAWLVNVATTNTDTAYITKDDKLRNKSSVQIREIISKLPPYLIMLAKADIKNSERVTVKNLNNTLNIYVGRTDKKAADNVGRGMTVPTAIIDEAAYIPNIEITLPTLLAATTRHIQHSCV